MANVDLQDQFLNEFKNSNKSITVFLLNGYQMKGEIVDFDKYVILLKVDNQEHLIYKHAISTFVK